ncbi:MAG TPA: hypothetical protein VGG76_13530 [Gemmatimonadaceae bacterium]
MLKLLSAALIISAPAAAAQAYHCDTLQSQVTLGSLSGQKIDSVLVETAQPSLGRAARAVGRLHIRTRESVVRRELLFAAGDTVDTLAVAESLRRLRSLAFLANAGIEARRCTSDVGHTLALTVMTRDSWTARPDLRGGSGSRIGLTERNLLGTGRTVSLDLVPHHGAIGGGVTVYDRFGFGTGVSTRAQYQRYSDGYLRGLLFSRRQATLSDPWRASLDISDQAHEPRGALSDNFERTSAELIGGVRVTPKPSSHAVYLLGGFATEHGSLVAAPNADILGPTHVERRFTGPEIGAATVATRYDTLTWLFDSGAVVDVPQGLEAEAVMGIGSGRLAVWDPSAPTDPATSRFMSHYDAWVGREWLPTPGSRVVTDLWAAGYGNAGDWSSSHLRAALSAEHAASNGVWRLTAASEQLNDPDPDVRALAIYDRALAFVPSRARFAESALAISVERTRHIRPVGGALELDGSLFGALSKRWDPSPTSLGAEDVSVGLLGAGLALSPRHAGRATLRLDYGVPVVATPGIKRAPRLSITVMPWLETGRHRDRTGSF